MTEVVDAGIAASVGVAAVTDISSGPGEEKAEDGLLVAADCGWNFGIDVDWVDRRGGVGGTLAITTSGLVHTRIKY